MISRIDISCLAAAIGSAAIGSDIFQEIFQWCLA